MNSFEPCPCQNLIKQYGNMISRRCGGSYSQGGVWNSMDYSQCGLTSRTIELCEALHVSEATACMYINMNALIE